MSSMVTICMKKLTLFFQIEQIVNNRPLSYVYPSDLECCITPNHLLFGRRLESIAITPVCSFDPHSQPDISSDNVNSILDHFWDRWRREYLGELRQQHKSFSHSFSSSKICPQVGDVVIIHEEFIPRHMWRLGVIKKLIKSRDGLVRGAEVLVGKTGNTIKRPVNKLFPIEYTRKENSDDN